MYIALFLVCMATVAVFVANDKLASPPEPTANAFLSAIVRGDQTAIAPYFGDVSCSCPPKGGYVSYLRYDSGEDPNLAFLIGHPFETGHITETRLNEKFPYLAPWDKPESFMLSMPLIFTGTPYSPFLLPLPMAFGKTMSERAFNEYADDPSEEGAHGLSLRLRATVEPGLVSSSSGSARREPAEKLPYLFPLDAGPVVNPDGKPLASTLVASSLPRLQSVMLHLKMERRGSHNPWLVSRFRFSDAIVQLANEQTVKLSDARPQQNEQ